MFTCCDPFLSSLGRFSCYNSLHKLQCHTAWYPKFSMLHFDILCTVRCLTPRKAHKISQNKLHS